MDKNIMKAAGFGAEVEAVEHGFCPFCKHPVNKEDFRNDISRKEYEISGICYNCQLEFFGE